MTSMTGSTPSLRHLVLQVLSTKPDTDLSTEWIHRQIAAHNVTQRSVRDALYGMSKREDFPVRRGAYGRYRYSSRSKAAVALRAYAAASQIRSEALPALKVVEVPEAVVSASEPTVAVVPDHAPVLGGDWERIRRVPASITSLMPLKDTESLVVTEDGRYFILAELVS